MPSETSNFLVSPTYLPTLVTSDTRNEQAPFFSALYNVYFINNLHFVVTNVHTDIGDTRRLRRSRTFQIYKIRTANRQSIENRPREMDSS